jgi:hypothetical protein
MDELSYRLETALGARGRTELRKALRDLPATWPWPESDLLREALRSPGRLARNAAIVVGTAVVWLFWSVGMLVAYVAWLATNRASLVALLVFPLLWVTVSWLLWSGGRRWRSRT